MTRHIPSQRAHSVHSSPVKNQTCIYRGAETQKSVAGDKYLLLLIQMTRHLDGQVEKNGPVHYCPAGHNLHRQDTFRVDIVHAVSFTDKFIGDQSAVYIQPM